jgi:hypothetical protein
LVQLHHHASMPRRAALLVGLLVAVAPMRARADLPASVVDRPSTLPDGMLQVDAAFDHESRRALGVHVLDAQTLRLAARWGLSERVELGLDTRVRVHPDADWPREATPVLAWRVFDAPDRDLTPTMRVPLFADRGYDVATHLDFGLGLRWRVTDQVLLSVGRTLTSVDFRPVVAWHLLLDASVGVQMSPILELEAAVGLGEVTLAGQLDRSSAPWNTLPAAVRAVWAARPGIDVVGELRSSALQQGNDLEVTLGISVRP